MPREADQDLPIAGRLYAARSHAGLSCKALAEAAGIDAGTIHRIENGKNLPSASTIRRLAAALGIDPAYLFS